MLLPDLCPVSDLRSDLAGHIKRVKRSKRPLQLTQDGRDAGVMLIPTVTYEQLTAEREAAQVKAAIEQGIREAKAGKGRPAEEVFRDLLAGHAKPARRRSR